MPLEPNIKWNDDSGELRLQEISDNYLREIIRFLHKSNDIDRDTDSRYWMLEYLIQELEKREEDPVITMYIASDGSHKEGHCRASVIFYLYDYYNGYYQRNWDVENFSGDSAHEAEVRGCEMALERIEKYSQTVDRVNYYTDYMSLVNSLERDGTKLEWLQKDYNKLQEEVDVRTIHSPSHSGHMYNELADELANLRGEEIGS